jgi:hypothetical protein
MRERNLLSRRAIDLTYKALNCGGGQMIGDLPPTAANYFEDTAPFEPTRQAIVNDGYPERPQCVLFGTNARKQLRQNKKRSHMLLEQALQYGGIIDSDH